MQASGRESAVLGGQVVEAAGGQPKRADISIVLGYRSCESVEGSRLLPHQTSRSDICESFARKNVVNVARLTSSHSPSAMGNLRAFATSP
jgi:hypothetical protein